MPRGKKKIIEDDEDLVYDIPSDEEVEQKPNEEKGEKKVEVEQKPKEEKVEPAKVEIPKEEKPKRKRAPPKPKKDVDAVVQELNNSLDAKLKAYTEGVEKKIEKLVVQKSTLGMVDEWNDLGKRYFKFS